MTDVQRFVKMINGGYSCISVVTHEEHDTLEIVRQAAMALKREVLIWSMGYGVRDGLLAGSPAEPETDTAGPGLCGLAAAKNGTICVTLDLAEHLKNDLTRRVLRDTIDRIDINGCVLVMIDNEDKLPLVIRSYTKRFDLSLPDKDDLEQFVRSTLRNIHRKKPIEVGITHNGMKAIVRNLRGLTRRQAQRLIRDTLTDDNRFDDNDVNVIMAGKRRLIKGDGLLEYVQTPLTLDGIGGMNNLKNWLKHRKDAFSEEAKEFGINAPRGVLMLGVQGAGKSLCAKAIATAWQQPLLRLDCGSLYNSYIGESERNLRKALEQAEFMSPVILWIDEIEKAFASAASHSTDGGLSKRMFASLLTWMQEHTEPVFLVATANDIEALPPELLRKGRFDEIFFVGLPNKDARRKIFSIHIDKRKRRSEDFDLDKLADNSQGYSGAEIEQAVVSSLHLAFADKHDIDTTMIISVLKSSPPLSVTMAEKIEALCQWADGRCVPAD